MPVALTRARPMTLERTDEILALLVRGLRALDGEDRRVVLVELDRLLDIRLALSRAPLEAGG